MIVPFNGVGEVIAAPEGKAIAVNGFAVAAGEFQKFAFACLGNAVTDTYAADEGEEITTVERDFRDEPIILPAGVPLDLTGVEGIPVAGIVAYELTEL